jgi:hypothetical protein
VRKEKEGRTVRKGNKGEGGGALLEKERKEKEGRNVRKGKKGEGGAQC